MKPLFPQPPRAGNQARGARAQAQGALFEDLFLRSCQRLPMAITQLPAGCKVIGKDRLVRIKTDFDWVLTFKGQTALIDTKTVAGQRFSPPDEETLHQVHALSSHYAAGAVAGYVIWFREADQVCFLAAPEIQLMLATRKGYRFTEMKQLGPIASFDPRLIFSSS